MGLYLHFDANSPNLVNATLPAAQVFSTWKKPETDLNLINHQRRFQFGTARYRMSRRSRIRFADKDMRQLRNLWRFPDIGKILAKVGLKPMQPGARRAAASVCLNERFDHHTRCMVTETLGPFLMV
jgi:hypothetical protein